MVQRANNPQYQDLVVGTDVLVPLRNGQLVKSINFDNAATTPPFHAVLQEIIALCPWYASVHRGSGYKSQYISRYYETARKVVASFIKADLEKDTVIFVKNTTEAINKVAHLLSSRGEDQVILTTAMEHHSNDLPWRDKFHVDYISTDEEGQLSTEDLLNKLNKYGERVRLVAITGASNVTGHKNPIHKIASLTHQYQAEILVDGAQLVPHAPVDMKSHSSSEHIDYLVFSSHKMYAPFGIGVLIGPLQALSNNPPHMPGGGTVNIVTPKEVIWNELPHREEAGTPNLMGVAALTAAIRSLQLLGLENIEAYECQLMEYALHRLKLIPGMKLYGNYQNLRNRVSIISFNLEGIPHDLLAKILSMEGGISVRNGCFCAQPYVQGLLNISEEEIKERMNDLTLPHPGMVRVSFGCYNTYEEIDCFANLLISIALHRPYYLALYQELPDFFE